jgi:hypothetical protein
MSLLEILKEKKKRNRIILAILTIILPVVVYLQFFKKPNIQEGAERAVYCTKCKTIGAKVIVNIDDDKDMRNYCKLCGGRLRYAAKCLHCQYQFPLSPLTEAPPPGTKTTMDKFRHVRDKEKCPNCGILPPQTEILSSDKLKNKIEL